MAKNWWSSILDLVFGPVEVEVVDLDKAWSQACAVAVLEKGETSPDAARWWEPEGETVTQFVKLSAPAQQPVDLAAIAVIEKVLSSPEIELPHLPQIPQQVLTLLRQENVNFK